MTIDRETLAEKLLIADVGKHGAANACVSDCFDLVGAFFHYVENQRKDLEARKDKIRDMLKDIQPEPPKCEHRPEWITNMGYCAHCGQDVPEPAPKREARKVWVEFFSNGQPQRVWSEQSADESLTLFREVLE